MGTDLNWQMIGTGDFSQDGKIDLLLTNYATGANVVWVMDRLNYQGAASLQSDVEANWRSSTVGDFNKFKP